jgi:hypothetical protein
LAQTPPKKLPSPATPTVGSPQTAAKTQHSHHPRLLAAPSPNTHSPLNPRKASPPPPKVPPKRTKKGTSCPKPTKQTHLNHRSNYRQRRCNHAANLKANSHSRFFRLIHNSTPLGDPLSPGVVGRKNRAFHWLKRRTKVRYKPPDLHLRCTTKPRLCRSSSGPTTVISQLEDAHIAEIFQPEAGKCRGEREPETHAGLWLRVSTPEWQQGTRPGRVPTKREPPLDYFSDRRRPPKRPPDGDYPPNDDFRVKSGSPDLAVQNMKFFRRAMDKEVISGFTGGARRPPEISGGRTGSPGRTAGGKLQEIYAKEGMRFCGTKGSVKSGDNILPILSLFLRLLLRDIRIFG